MDFYSDLIDYSCDGGDGWYPNGFFNIDLNYFKSTGRGFDKPVIWCTRNIEDIQGSFKLSNEMLSNECEQDLEYTLVDNILFNVDNIDDLNHFKTTIGGIIVMIEGIDDNNNNDVIDSLFFCGQSNLGKSFIAHEFFNKVYESDSCDNFKTTNYSDYDVCVIGNKYDNTDFLNTLNIKKMYFFNIVEYIYHF